MNHQITADERIFHLSIEGGYMFFVLVDGRVLGVPLAWYPKLGGASQAAKDYYEIVDEGFAVHWPELDEDLEISGLLAGNADPAIRGTIDVSPLKIKEYRDEAGISQSDLATILNVRQATVSDWEKGNAAPSPLAKMRLTEFIRKAYVRSKPLSQAKAERGTYPNEDTERHRPATMINEPKAKYLTSKKQVHGSRNSLKKEPGSNSRHRDQVGEIRTKRGEGINKNRSRTIKMLSPDSTISRMRELTGKVSLNTLQTTAKKR